MEKFRQTIQTGTHLVYFGATWCKNCVPIKNDLAAQKNVDNVHIYDVDEHEDEAAVCVVTRLPTIQVWTNGKLISKYEGKGECEIGVIIHKHFTNDYLQNVDTEEDF